MIVHDSCLSTKTAIFSGANKALPTNRKYPPQWCAREWKKLRVVAEQVGRTGADGADGVGQGQGRTGSDGVGQVGQVGRGLAGSGGVWRGLAGSGGVLAGSGGVWRGRTGSGGVGRGRTGSDGVGRVGQIIHHSSFIIQEESVLLLSKTFSWNGGAENVKIEDYH